MRPWCPCRSLIWNGSGRNYEDGPIASFPIRIGHKSRWLLWVFGVRGDESEVSLKDGWMVAHFGSATMRTPIGNISRWRIEGPFHWLTAIGIRRSIRHGDVSFAGSPHGGLRMDFRERVRWSLFHVPALYVSVDDLAGLAAELTRLGIPGEDVRKAK